MGVGFRNSRREQNFKESGVGFSRKPEDQTDTLLIAPGSRTRTVVKHVLQELPPFFFLEVSSLEGSG